MAPEKRRRIAAEEDHGSTAVGGSAGESGHDVIVRTLFLCWTYGARTDLVEIA